MQTIGLDIQPDSYTIKEIVTALLTKHLESSIQNYAKTKNKTINWNKICNDIYGTSSDHSLADYSTESDFKHTLFLQDLSKSYNKIAWVGLILLFKLNGFEGLNLERLNAFWDYMANEVNVSTKPYHLSNIMEHILSWTLEHGSHEQVLQEAKTEVLEWKNEGSSLKPQTISNAFNIIFTRDRILYIIKKIISTVAVQRQSSESRRGQT